MTQKHPEVNHVIQPVAGIGNWGSGNHSTAAVHFAPARLFVSRQLHMPVLSPIVPSNFGIFGSTKKMSSDFANDLERELAPYPNARVTFLSHSFGTLLCEQYALLSPDARERYAGAIALGSPLLGVEVGRWPGFKRTEKNINAFAADVRAAHEAEGDSAGLAMIGTTLDVMVQPHSALPAIPHKQRHLFTLPGSSHEDLGNVQTHVNLGIDHNGLVAHPQAILLITQVARQLIKEQSGAVADVAYAAAIA